jgi:hypothetical protein
MTRLSFGDLQCLHTSLYSRFQKYNLNLQAVEGCESAAGFAHNGTQVVAYLRSANEAQAVEAMMGRDLPSRRLDLRRHPVIELRATSTGVVLEYILPPEAWWDQQNFAGKLSIERHRTAFRRLITRMDDRYSLGFWHGLQQDSTGVTPTQISHPSVFDLWITTFCNGQDWFRAGVWYDELPENLPGELFRHAQTLYELYRFISWTGSNDYRSFAERASAYA